MGAFGEKPSIPGLPQISPGAIQQMTAEENLAVLPTAKATGAGVDQYNLDQLAKALNFWSPGAFGRLQSTISSQLKGELAPEDTRALISSATAAGYGKGFGSSFGSRLGIGRNLVLRDLGIGVEQQKQRGLSNLMGLYGAGPRPFDVTSMFFTPAQRLNFAFLDRSARYERDLLAARVAAAPDPATAALGAEVDRLFQTMANDAHDIGKSWTSLATPMGSGALSGGKGPQLSSPSASGGGGGTGGGGWSSGGYSSIPNTSSVDRFSSQSWWS